MDYALVAVVSLLIGMGVAVQFAPGYWQYRTELSRQKSRLLLMGPDGMAQLRDPTPEIELLIKELDQLDNYSVKPYVRGRLTAIVRNA